MKGLLLAAGASLVCAVLITVVLRTGASRRALAMVIAFLATVPLYLGAYALTPGDLGFLPARFVESRAFVAYAFGLFVHAALFFGGWLQVYNLAERGFSLRILIDVLESPRGALSQAEIHAWYGGGKGLGWMQDKRIEGLLEEGFAVLREGRLHPTAKGARAARLFGALRVFLRLDAP